ncbi:cbb3-type cytochrome oxidase assembly protein CcoS [uncultured Shewanella sp.]|uniref:cbb3-type cytochrome oxidase assembly protein CcoS n=1 Tax=uncultured Shewanella sp. TaxID=173975 RepID=UPI002622F985|nr:cbb3-type cytochrome oxidase assembly protein CcoS [uncultured Shewanella sp.]
MSIIYVLIPIAIIFVIIAVCVFFWAVRSDQFDDLEKQSVSILFDDEPSTAHSESKSPIQNQHKPQTEKISRYE